MARPRQKVARAQRFSDRDESSCYKPVKAPSTRAIRELLRSGCQSYAIIPFLYCIRNGPLISYSRIVCLLFRGHSLVLSSIDSAACHTCHVTEQSLVVKGLMPISSVGPIIIPSNMM